MNLFSKKLFQIFSRLHTNTLQGRSLMAYNNPFLCIALYHNNRADSYNIFIFQKFFGINFNSIGNFLFIMQQNFFANGLVYEKPLRLIGQLILWIKRRRFWKQYNNSIEHFLYLKAFFGRNGNNLCIGYFLGPKLYLAF